MLFDTLDYWLFFAAVLVIFYQLPFRYGRLFLLAASYAFYANWSAGFLLVILASTVIDYALGLRLGSATGAAKRMLLGVSLFVNLGALGFFKYYNLFASSIATLAGKPSDSWALKIILPIGISFYTFASLSYTIDVYWGRMKPVRNLVDYALFVSFFPHLPAGPVVRARQFVVQIWRWHKPAAVVVQSGIVLVLCGLVKKMIFADRFALISDTYFNDIGGHPGWLAAASGAAAFWMQIFFDFSGYTDIARGCAKLLGFEFPLNFIRPYLATNVVQFWQRWHISLSRWMHDYVFKPLTGKRAGKLLLARNVMITMICVGLWHGASWQFLVWGAYYGVLLIAYRAYRQLTRRTTWRTVTSRRGFVPVAVALTTLSLIIPLILFRAATWAEALTVLRSLTDFNGVRGENILTPLPIVLFFVAFVLALIEERHQVIQRLATASLPIRVSGYILVFLALELFSVTEQRIPFVYFQF